MNCWIVFGLLALALVVLVSPGIVGKLAEQNLRASITRAEHDNEGLVVTEERFERGWFTAAGRYRIALDEAASESAETVIAGEPGKPPALIVETRIDHGLLPVTSMARDAGSLQPSLASTLSKLSLDFGDGRIVELPGQLQSRIGLTGATHSHYDLEPGSFEHDGLALEWRGADIRFSIDAGASEMDYAGRIEPFSWTRDGRASTLGVTEFEGEQQKTPYGFSTGAIALSLRDASLASPVGGAASGFASLELEAGNTLQDGRVSGDSSIDVGQLLIPGLGEVDFGLDLSVAGLDAASLMRIRETLDAAREAGELDTAMSDVYPNIEADLHALLAAGAGVIVERFLLSLPQGDVHGTLELELPATRHSPGFSWPTLLLALKASAEIRVAAAVLESMQTLAPDQVRTLVATGFLEREGDVYVMTAEYGQGLVTINGAPMPVPIGLIGAEPRD